MTDEDRALPKPPPASPNPPNPSTPGIQKPGNKPDGRDDPREGETR
jgi:hypothetical protein